MVLMMTVMMVLQAGDDATVRWAASRQSPEPLDSKPNALILPQALGSRIPPNF